MQRTMQDAPVPLLMMAYGHSKASKKGLANKGDNIRPTPLKTQNTKSQKARNPNAPQKGSAIKVEPIRTKEAIDTIKKNLPKEPEPTAAQMEKR